MADIVFDAKKAKKEEQKELQPTYAQKKAEQKSKKNLALNNKMFLNGIKRGKMVNNEGIWERIKTKEEGYRIAMGKGLDIYDPDVKKAIEGIKKGNSPYIESTPEVDQAIAQKIQEARNGGMPDEQIAEMLREKKLDPTIYGLR